MATRPAPAASGTRPIDPTLRIASVELAVSDLRRSVQFYTQALGLTLIGQDEQQAELGPQESPAALRLRRLRDPVPAPPHSTGLFHVAWLHPSRSELAASIERLIEARWPIDGASDHGVSEAIYLSDPDGLGIEIYADRPRESWPRPADGAGVDIFTRPLDLDDLLAQSPLDREPAMPAAVRIGHVHLKVADVERAATYYRDALGFEEQARMPSAAFLSAGGYHHHIGLNSWQSRGEQPPPDNAPGLRQITFALSGIAALPELLARLQYEPDEAAPEVTRGQLRVSDPDGNRLAFVARP